MPIIKRDQLPWSEIAHELVGAEHGLAITLLFVDAEPGRGPALHRHPYAEVMIVQDGEADTEGAPTAGPPPYDVYEVTPPTAFGLGTDKSFSPTRWRFSQPGAGADG